MVQLSVDSTKPAAWHFEMGRKPATLRDEGVMLVASGMVQVVTCGLCVGTVTIYCIPRAASFNDSRKQSTCRGRGRQQSSLVNYLQHEGAPYRTRRRSTFALLYVPGA